MNGSYSHGLCMRNKDTWEQQQATGDKMTYYSRTKGDAIAAHVEHHRSLPSAEKEENSDAERARMFSGVGRVSSLLSRAILRTTRWLEGLFDMLESSLGGSELKSTC